MRVDVNAFLGRYPYREVPGNSAESLLEAMDRVGTDQTWLSNLDAVFAKDPIAGNDVLYHTARDGTRFRPVPSIHPNLRDWVGTLKRASDNGAPCVRCDPTFLGLDPAGAEVRAVAAACGEAGMPMLMAVRLEDIRQRHPDDRAPEIEPAHLRALIRSDRRLKLIVTHADRECIEQVHFGSTPGEAARILWDITWIWGPPEDHLALLLDTVGVERFGFGTGMPLRIPENSIAKLDLLDLDPATRNRIEASNLSEFLSA